MSWHFWNLLKSVGDAVLQPCFAESATFTVTANSQCKRCEQALHHSCCAAVCLYSHQKCLQHVATAASLHFKYMKTAEKRHTIIRYPFHSFHSCMLQPSNMHVALKWKWTEYTANTLMASLKWYERDQIVAWQPFLLCWPTIRDSAIEWGFMFRTPQYNRFSDFGSHDLLKFPTE